MKKYIIPLALVICTLSSFAQNNNSNSILVRHDTTLLKASECEWIIKSLTKNNPALTSENWEISSADHFAGNCKR